MPDGHRPPCSSSPCPGSPPHDPANLLGALAIAAADRVLAVAADGIGHGGETGAALVAIGHMPGLSNDALGRALSLSHPGTVRLVDRLVAAGLVTRAVSATDRRAVALALTDAGRARREAILADREAALAELLAPLSASERTRFAALAAKMLRGRARTDIEGLAICRLCDEARCANCPIDAGIADAAGPGGATG